jgi:hypothetical protein
MGCRTAAESPLKPCAAGVVADLQRMAGVNADACTTAYSPKYFLAVRNAFPNLCPMMNFQHNIWWWQLIP